jgi:uncharacterized protein (DUF58 family)
VSRGPSGARGAAGVPPAAATVHVGLTGQLLALWRRYLGEPAPRREVPADLGRRLARLELAAARRAAGPWAGAYRSAFRGLGIEFAGVREYTPGDDVRTIDWRVTARTGRLAVRRYVEERERPLLFVVDVGPTTEVGSGERTLREVAAEVVALIGSAALVAGDRVGLLAWGEHRRLLLAPQRRPGTLLRLVRELLLLSPAAASDLRGALAEASRLLPHRSVVVVISPLAAEGDAAKATALAHRHDVVLVRVWDPRAARGTAAGAVPARSVGGRRGVAAGEPPRPWAPTASAALRTATVTPASDITAALGHVFEPRERRAGA